MRVVQDLATKAKTIINWKLVKNEGENERIEYEDTRKVFVESIKAHGHEQKSLSKGVLICFGLDVANFSQNQGHTSIRW